MSEQAGWTPVADQTGWAPIGVTPGAHPEARIGAAEHPLGQPNIALPPGRLDGAGMRKAVSPAVEQFMTSPLVHPTGIDAIDSLLSPSSLAMMAATSGPAAVRAFTGAVTNLTEQAGSAVTKKLLKFVTPSILKKPAELAELLNEFGKAVSASKAESGATIASPIASGPVAPVPPAAAPSVPSASAAPASAPPPIVASAPSPLAPPPARMGPNGLLEGRPGGNPDMPDQGALNEAALAARRAAYQERLKTALPTAAPAAAAPANVKLNAAETKAFLDLMQRGMAGPEAMKNVLMQRELVQRLATPTPTAAETRFPKGMRGKVQP